MGTDIILNVKTVPAWDCVQMKMHTAYTVTSIVNGEHTYAPGWALKDAIENYSSIYSFQKEMIKVKRPFKKQIIKLFPIPPL